jgi:hypothetical protein
MSAINLAAVGSINGTETDPLIPADQRPLPTQQETARHVALVIINEAQTEQRIEERRVNFYQNGLTIALGTIGLVAFIAFMVFAVRTVGDYAQEHPGCGLDPYSGGWVCETPPDSVNPTNYTNHTL